MNPTPEAVTDTRYLRRVLGRFTTGVTVVTACDTGTAEGDRSVHGMTANAFTSVSLSPPLVLVSIAATARMDRCIRNSGAYGVSVLAEHQAAIADRFAGRGADETPVRFRWIQGVPVLTEALGHVICSLHRSVPAGDHTLHLGKVQGVDSRAGRPLVFYAGDFCLLDKTGESDPWWI